ncbi:MAG: DUF523 domain-containing protein [Coprobacillus sp.]|nr:DUF523 domain-containing protein [Coprobacillus sp.]
MKKEKILISSCLVGDKVRYDGRSNQVDSLDELLEKYELVPFCSEVEGGLRVPRAPSEREGDRVINSLGKDVTKQYHLGAERALNICKYLGITKAILKDKSPACGVYEIYDGTFAHKKKKGEGTTTALLRENGITVYSEKDIPQLLNNSNFDADD